MSISFLSPEQLNELEATVKNLYTNGSTDEQDEILQTWFTDPQYFPLAKQIIEENISDPSDSKSMLTHFAMRSFCSLLDYVCPIWELQELKDMSKWCLNIFLNQTDRFISLPLLMQAFCTMYSQLVIFGWHVSKEFQEFISPMQSEDFWENLTKGPAANWCCQIRLYTGIVEKMEFIHNLETAQVKTYKEDPLFDCFDFAVKTLFIILNQQLPKQYTEEDVFSLIEYSLQLLEASLSFDYDITQFDSIKFKSWKISLPSPWSSKSQLKLYEIVDCLFQLYEQSPPNLQESFLNVLFLFSLIRNDSHSKPILDRLDYAEPFFIYLSKNINQKLDESIMNDENLPTIINIILKIFLLTQESRVEDLFKVESFPDFIQAVYSLTKTIFCVDFLLTSPDSIINILMFWEELSIIINKCNTSIVLTNQSREGKPIKEDYILEDSVYDLYSQYISNAEPLIEDIVDSYISLLNQVVQEQPESAHEVLFSDLKRTNPLTTLVLSISRFNGSKIHQNIIDTFNEFLAAYAEDPRDLILELQLGLFAMLISPPVLQKVNSRMLYKNQIKRQIMPNDSSRSFPQAQHFISSSSSCSFQFHSIRNHESDGDNVHLGLDSHDHFHFSIGNQDSHDHSHFSIGTQDFGSNSTIGNSEDDNNDSPLESIFKSINMLDDESMSGIFNLFKVTSDLIQNGFTCNVYMEEIILFLITKFIASALINHRSIINFPEIVAENTGIQNSDDLNILFTHRIIASISTFYNNDRIFSLCIDAITTWKYSEAIPNKTTFIKELLDVYSSQLDQIFDSLQSKYIRVRFHEAIVQIISSINSNDSSDSETESQIFDTFFQGLSQRYELLREDPNEELALGLLLDLRGIVSGTSQNKTYTLAFNFIFPYLELFHQMALEYSSLVIPYLEFLAEFTDKKNGRIFFPPHSSNGLKLAKASMLFCIAFFENAPRSLDQSSNGILYTITIMDHILDNEYSNLGAMIAYNDPILAQLFTSFLDFAHVVDFNEIVRYPDHLVQIIHLMICLFTHFSNFIVDIDISFLETGLIICTYSDDTRNLAHLKDTFKVISSITDCCVKLQGTEKGQELFDNTRDTFANVLRMLENCIMKMRFKISVKRDIQNVQELTVHYGDLIDLTKNVLRMEPPNWPEVRQRLSLFLNSPLDEEIKQMINELASIE